MKNIPAIGDEMRDILDDAPGTTGMLQVRAKPVGTSTSYSCADTRDMFAVGIYAVGVNCHSDDIGEFLGNLVVSCGTFGAARAGRNANCVNGNSDRDKRASCEDEGSKMHYDCCCETVVSA